MILKAEEGDYNWIFGTLRDNLACADVADSKGYTVLAAAAVSPFCIGTLACGLPQVAHSNRDCLIGAAKLSKLPTYSVIMFKAKRRRPGSDTFISPSHT